MDTGSRQSNSPIKPFQAAEPISGMLSIWKSLPLIHLKQILYVNSTEAAIEDSQVHAWTPAGAYFGNQWLQYHIHAMGSRGTRIDLQVVQLCEEGELQVS